MGIIGFVLGTFLTEPDREESKVKIANAIAERDEAKLNAEKQAKIYNLEIDNLKSKINMLQQQTQNLNVKLNESEALGPVKK